MHAFGKMLLALGLLLVIVGGLFLLAARLGLPLGRLPGDFHWQSRGGRTQVYFPLGSSILLSLALSLLLWLVRRL